MKLFLQLLANGLVNGALYAVMAVGFGLVWRSLRVFHIVYGGLYVLCAYLFYVFAAVAELTPTFSFLLTLVFAGATGWLVEAGLYRPFYLKRAGSGAVLIASLGAFVVLENLIALVFGNELKTIPRGIAATYWIGPVVLTELQLLELAVGAGVVALSWLFVRRLQVFKALWAMGDQPELIPVLGLPLFKLRVLALVVSTVMAAIPACLISLDVGLDPHMGMSYLLIAAVAVLIGGVDSYIGWVSGAMMLAVLQSLAVWQLSARWMDLVTFSLLVVLLVFRPQGLLDRAKRLEETA